MAVCEMCGSSGFLQKADVESVEMALCKNCQKYGTLKQRPSSRNFKHKRRFERVELQLKSNFAQTIKAARDKLGMSQEEFAKHIEEKESVVAKWEHGTLKPSIGIAKTLERKLHISILQKESNDTNSKGDQDRPSYKSKKNDELTLGDFIKVRKRK